MSAVVGAGFPRPMGWGTQPLHCLIIVGGASPVTGSSRTCPDALIRGSAYMYIPPLWGSIPPPPLVSSLPPLPASPPRCVLALNIPPFPPAPTLHSAGVLLLDQSSFYRHYAPLERKAIPLPRSLIFPPLGLNPSRFLVFSLPRFPVSSFSRFLAFNPR